MDSNTIIQNTFGQIMSNAAQAMSDAVKQYGPDAVELGLVVYRISALQEIVIGLGLFFLGIGFLIWGRFFVKWERTSNRSTYEPPLYGFCAALVLIVGVVCSVVSLGDLFNVYNWAALFGYPEILITYKALVAAGLM